MSTALCQHCQAISLDDEKLGGTTFTPDDGEPFLYFGRDVEGSEGHFSIKIPGFRADEFPDLPRMQLSAANGCSLCGLLRSAVLNQFPPQEFNRENQDTAIRILVLKNFVYHWHSVEWDKEQEGCLAYLAFLSLVAVIQDRDDELSRKVYFEVSAPPGPLATWLRIPWNVADENALSPARIRDIKSWISDCEQNCHHAGITETVPTRLIDVGSEDKRDQMRLILSSDIQKIHHGAESCKYTTLSYCWGDQTSKPFFTTEKSTLQQLRQKIPLERLPRTFRDAVAVTRSLGIRYLWIDALCIVQDDSEDWAKESAIMGKIYANSYVTLIAVKGESCHDGFLDRATARKVPIYYESSLKPHVNGIYWLRQVSEDYADGRAVVGRFAVMLIDTKGSRWNSRGWTLQEQYLSVRKLIFGAERMYYDCGSRVWTESLCRWPTLEDWTKSFWDSLSQDPNPKKLHSVWYAVVEEYSDRVLTCSTDRLPAISGLAETFHERMAGDYLAGLWRSDLLDGLLWIRFPWKLPVMCGATFIDSVVHPRHYTAPSWSWARSKQNVAFVYNLLSYPHNVSEIEVLEAMTFVIGPNRFGRVQDGHILLRGKTFGLKGALITDAFRTETKPFEWRLVDGWFQTISRNGFEIARCSLDWETSEDTKYFELFEPPWDQLMMIIIASYSIHSEDSEIEENEEADEDEEGKEDEKNNEGDEGEEHGDGKEDGNDERNESGDDDRQREQDEEDNTDGKEDEEDNSSEEPRVYSGLLLLPTSEEANSWVRVGVFMLRSDEHGRAILDNCSERIVRVV